MKPAIEGGVAVRKSFLPFALPTISEDDIREVARALESGWLTVGPRTKQFQEALADYVGSKGAVALGSCTAAIHLSLVAVGVGPGDEVIVPVLCFAAVPNAVIHCGAEPVFADVDPGTLNISTEEISRLAGPRTKAVVPLYFGGMPLEVGEVREQADSIGAKVIADAAHALGTRFSDARVGREFTSTCFSFYVTKNITTGEGGAVTSDDVALLEEIELLALHGMSHDSWLRYTEGGSWYYEIVRAGYKYNMSDLQAALGLSQLRKAQEFLERRTQIARRYTEAFRELEAIKTPPEDQGHSWHLYPIQLKREALRVDRAFFIKALAKENIGTSVHFIPIHLHPFYRKRTGLKERNFPNAENYYLGAVSLPIYPRMTDADVEDVVTAVMKLCDYYRS